jgi:hypothetical protein
MPDRVPQILQNDKKQQKDGTQLKQHDPSVGVSQEILPEKCRERYMFSPCRVTNLGVLEEDFKFWANDIRKNTLHDENL